MKNIDLYTQNQSYNSENNTNSKYDAVVCGLDFNINMYKLNYAANLILKNSAHFIATNPDKGLPCRKGVVKIGNGSIQRALELSTNKKATIIGKPSNYCWTFMTEKFNIKYEETLMIGDNINTDIQFARSENVDALLVLTGVTKGSFIYSDLYTNNKFLPNYIQKDLSVL